MAQRAARLRLRGGERRRTFAVAIGAEVRVFDTETASERVYK